MGMEEKVGKEEKMGKEKAVRKKAREARRTKGRGKKTQTLLDLPPWTPFLAFSPILVFLAKLSRLS